MNLLKQLMHLTTKRVASEINRHNDMALSKMEEATIHVTAAAKLLQGVRDTIPPGEWDAWVKANIKTTS